MAGCIHRRGIGSQVAKPASGCEWKNINIGRRLKLATPGVCHVCIRVPVYNATVLFLQRSHSSPCITRAASRSYIDTYLRILSAAAHGLAAAAASVRRSFSAPACQEQAALRTNYTGYPNVTLMDNQSRQVASILHRNHDIVHRIAGVKHWRCCSEDAPCPGAFFHPGLLQSKLKMIS